MIMRILRSIERSPAAVREFVARADAKALAEGRPITVAGARTSGRARTGCHDRFTEFPLGLPEICGN